MALAYLKDLGRETLSERNWAILSRLKARLKYSLTIWPFVRTIMILPHYHVVRIKEHMKLKGRLDYSRGNILMKLDSSEQIMRLSSCAKEPETVKWIESFIHPDEVFYDVGANVGSYSFVAYVATDGNCKVYAFEPSFSTFAALSENILLNDCHGKIVPLHIALSDETGLTTFNYSAVSPGAALHSVSEAVDQNGNPFQPSHTQPILSYRLDDIIRDLNLHPPNHIKIDTDGTETKVLKGADITLSDPVLRSIFIEVNEERPTGEEIIRHLQDKGFSIYARYAAGASEGFFNYVFERRL